MQCKSAAISYFVSHFVANCVAILPDLSQLKLNFTNLMLVI